MYEISYDKEPIYRFVTSFMPVRYSEGMRAIGLLKDKEIVSGVLYDDWSGSNIWMHVASIPGRRWMTPSSYKMYAHACFDYPFNFLKCERITGWVEASNMDARKFDEHLGFRPEATLKRAARDGGDVILYTMFREDCKYA